MLAKKLTFKQRTVYLAIKALRLSRANRLTLLFLTLGYLIYQAFTVSLKSSWQHPHFNGSFLPVTKTIGDNGFSANWAVSSLSSSNQSTLLSN